MTPKKEADQIFNQFYANNQPYTFKVSPAKKSSIYFVNKLLSVLQDRFVCKNENQIILHYEQVKQELEKY